MQLKDIYYNVVSWFRWCFTKHKYNLTKEALSGQNFDYAYLLFLEQQKMEEMLNYYYKVTWINCDSIIRDLKICINLLDIILEKKQLYEYIWTGKGEKPTNRLANLELWEHRVLVNVNIKNAKRFYHDPKMDWIDKYREDLYQKKAWHLYNLIREYRLQTWWD